MAKFAKATEVNKRIKKVREQAGLTQKDFSQIIGISRSFLSEIEAGKVKPSLETLMGVVGHFQVDARWILVGEATGRETEPRVAEPSAAYGRDLGRWSASPGLPILKEKVAEGPPRRISPKDIQEYIPSWELLGRKEVCCFYIKDDAMAPLLKTGGLVALTPYSGPLKRLEGRLVAAWRKEGLAVRRFRIDSKYIILEPENKAFSALYLERSNKMIFFRVDWWLQRQNVGSTGKAE